jgi:hypothetical protein
MAKPETVTTPAVRETLPLKSTSLVVNARNFANKACIVNLDDSTTLDDVINTPSLWRVIQRSRDKALNEGDSVELRWHEQVAFTQVDYTDGDNVYFLKPQIFRRRERDRTPWRNQTYEVRMIDGAWSYYRISDNVRMTTKAWPNWEAAKSACIAEQSLARV